MIHGDRSKPSQTLLNNGLLSAEESAEGIASDPKAAATWYRRASELGDTEGAMLLVGLEGTAGR